MIDHEAGTETVEASPTSPEEASRSLLTLTEVARRTGISMPTLQRYKRLHGSRIPSVGEGRKERYPHEALDVFRRIKRENLERNSLPRPAGRLLSLTAQRRAAQEAQERKKVKEQEEGKTRRKTPPEAEEGAGNGHAARRNDAIARRIAALEASQIRLERELREVLRELGSPWTGSSEEPAFEVPG